MGDRIDGEDQQQDPRFTSGLYADTTEVLSQHGYQAAGTVESYMNTTTLLGWMTAAYEGKRFDPSILVTAEWVRANRP